MCVAVATIFLVVADGGFFVMRLVVLAAGILTGMKDGGFLVAAVLIVFVVGLLLIAAGDEGVTRLTVGGTVTGSPEAENAKLKPLLLLEESLLNMMYTTDVANVMSLGSESPQ